MTESEFEALARAALAALESAFEAGVPDADVQAKGTGLLEIEFEDGSKHGATRATGPNCLPQSRNLPRSRAERRSC